MSVQWFTPKKAKILCHCEADETQFSTVILSHRGRPPRPLRSQMVRHYRARDDAHYWHWRDRKVVKI